MATTPPEWGQNNEEGRRHMNEYRNLIIKGIKEAAPRGQNAKKAFEAQQEKEESPTEWLDRLRKNMKQYSGIDPETDVGKALLRINFVTNAWPDIRKKIEKFEDWHNKSLDDLLKEAQKVYVRRDEERAKLKAKLMAVTMQENNFQKIKNIQALLLEIKLVETRERKRIESQYKPSLSSIPGMSAFTVGVRDIIGEIVLSRVYAKLRPNLDMKEYFCNHLKANLARNPTVPFDLQKDLLPELWQNPETVVDNKNLPIRLAIQPDGSFQPYSKIIQLPSEPFVTFVEWLIQAIKLQVKNEGAKEQVLEEIALANANERCNAAILSLSTEPAPTLHDMLEQKSPDMIVKDPVTRETKSPHDQVSWGCGYAYVSTPPGLKWVPAKWVKPFIPKSAKPPAEAPQVASAAWRRRKRQTFSF
ncbi:hypothetical protein DUI87_17722 [Hirundo rustica rustica]|uniref:Uncharacterized protein n=1 Tax=Hirundo rustica rustica TaxID=333673 RepID=A0A3M0KEN2_HIRRU|nr:hypothetical protein DUI87_17722 [Hirundo rustica rustica]